MLKAADIMTKDVATIRSSATVAQAVELMNSRGWHALIVERRHDQDAYGIITEADIVYKVIAFGKDPSKLRVHEIMSKPCISINPNLGVEYVARLFAEHQLLRAPVIQGKLLGIISLVDIINESKFVEQPQEILLEEELRDAIEEARTICDRTSPRSQECSLAWDEVDELQAEIAHQQSKKIFKTAFEEYCEEFPEAMEGRVFDAWCSG